MYYPKSKILENQYTPGNEFKRKDNHNIYVGIYCILSDGKYFSGKTLNKSSIELLKTEKNGKKTNLNIRIPFNLINKIPGLFNLKDQKELKPSVINPTQQDYERGIITRYFAKKLNTKQIEIFEINPTSYIDITNISGKYLSIYQVINLDWKILGPDYDILSNNNLPIYGVIDTNRRTLELKEKEMIGITQYFNGRLKEFVK